MRYQVYVRNMATGEVTVVQPMPRTKARAVYWLLRLITWLAQWSVGGPRVVNIDVVPAGELSAQTRW